MNMGTYSNRSPMVPDPNAAASASQFAWYHPGNYFPVPKPDLTSFQIFPGTPANLGCVLAAPVNFTGLTDKPVGVVANSSATTPNPRKHKQPSKTPDQIASQATKPKKPRKKPSEKAKAPAIPETKRERKNPNNVIDISQFDFSGVPTPVCTCTGFPRVCYKWGGGGWQSSCCTISISEYPLPMNPAKPGSRVAGRKMSNRPYVKILLKLAAEGRDLSQPVDLKDHWARHGTNKFVTIK